MPSSPPVLSSRCLMSAPVTIGGGNSNFGLIVTHFHVFAQVTISASDILAHLSWHWGTLSHQVILISKAALQLLLRFCLSKRCGCPSQQSPANSLCSTLKCTELQGLSGIEELPKPTVRAPGLGSGRDGLCRARLPLLHSFLKGFQTKAVTVYMKHLHGGEGGFCFDD